MPGFLLHFGATVICPHGGHAQPTMPNPRVLVSTQPTATMPAPWGVVGCVPPSGPPCVTASFVTASLRVKSNFQPLLLFDSQAFSAQNGAPVRAVASQARVTAM